MGLAVGLLSLHMAAVLTNFTVPHSNNASIPNFVESFNIIWIIDKINNAGRIMECKKRSIVQLHWKPLLLT